MSGIPPSPKTPPPDGILARALYGGLLSTLRRFSRWFNLTMIQQGMWPLLLLLTSAPAVDVRDTPTGWFVIRLAAPVLAALMALLLSFPGHRGSLVSTRPCPHRCWRRNSAMSSSVWPSRWRVAILRRTDRRIPEAHPFRVGQCGRLSPHPFRDRAANISRCDPSESDASAAFWLVLGSPRSAACIYRRRRLVSRVDSRVCAWLDRWIGFRRSTSVAGRRLTAAAAHFAVIYMTLGYL